MAARAQEQPLSPAPQFCSFPNHPNSTRLDPCLGHIAVVQKVTRPRTDLQLDVPCALDPDLCSIRLGDNGRAFAFSSQTKAEGQAASDE
jgi:hypothetical protein